MDNTVNFQDIIKKSVLKLDVFSKVSLIDIVIGLIISGLIGLFIFYVYRKSYRGVVYSYTFNVTLVLMTMITCLIIMTISTNIVLSLGMVGALSIVRFRTALKDPLDIVFMFWAISVGISTGAGIYPISIIGSIVIAATIFLLARFTFADKVYLLVVHYSGEEASDLVKAKLRRMNYVLKSKTVRKELTELTAEVKVKNDNASFVQDISEIEGVKHVTLVSYDGDYAP